VSESALYPVTLVLHIASGFTAFIAAPVAMIVRKGGTAHRKAGRIFFWGMTGIFVTGITLSILHPNIFLFAVSGFSYYMAASGYRWVYRKDNRTMSDAARVDWLLLVLASLFNLFLFGLGMFAIAVQPAGAFGYVAGIFGLIGLFFVVRDLKALIRPQSQRHAWLLNHMGAMVGGYISTVSAFSAVNLDMLPTLVRWLWPTLLGVPPLILWIKSYRKKFDAGRRPGELVDLRSGDQRAGTTGSM